MRGNYGHVFGYNNVIIDMSIYSTSEIFQNSKYSNYGHVFGYNSVILDVIIDLL
jgi:hypothetical protein